MYPRTLDEIGLAAIRDLDPVSGRVEITVPAVRFPRDIEAAAYFLCVEALTNVAKYANATSTSVVITAADGTLVVEIADNGIGGADPAKGTGLLGLQDRLDVLGGGLDVQSSNRGTRIRGSLPLTPPWKSNRHTIQHLWAWRTSRTQAPRSQLGPHERTQIENRHNAANPGERSHPYRGTSRKLTVILHEVRLAWAAAEDQRSVVVFRRGRKNARMSSTRRGGSSSAGKCPPVGMSVHCSIR